MYDDRLPTGVWVQAGLALCSGKGIPAIVRHKGDPHTGVVLVKIATLNGAARLRTLQRNLDGVLRWVDALPSEASPADHEAEGYIDRARSRDPDLWVIEVEDKSGVNPFDTDEL